MIEYNNVALRAKRERDGCKIDLEKLCFRSQNTFSYLINGLTRMVVLGASQVRKNDGETASFTMAKKNL